MKQLVEAIRKRDANSVSDILRRSPELVSACDADAFGATPLIHAVLTDERGLVDLLLDAGADVDQRSDWWAGGFGVLDHGSDAMSEYLLERGATLTPHAAARLGLIDELRAMIEQDAERVHERGGDGQYPLHFARTPEIADVLLHGGAEIDARDVDHESTAAQWQATRVPDVAFHLLGRGCEADPFLAAAAGRIDVLERLATADAAFLQRRVSRAWFSTRGERAAEHIYFYTIGAGTTPLHAAALTNQGDVVRCLMDRGVDPEARGGYDEQTPLHVAAWHDAVDAAEALLDGGGDLEARSGSIHHNQPLGWAIVSGGEEMVRLLLGRGATLHPHHREAAEAGAQGHFRAYNRARPPGAWTRVRKLVRDR